MYNSTTNDTTYTYSMLGLAGTFGPNDSNRSPNPVVASWIIRDPSGRPVAQRSVVALEDPGTIQAAYDYCPTGNNAALPGGQLTTVGLNNPLRQGSVPYDDGTKDYFHGSGCIVEDASGVCTQQAGHAYLDSLTFRPAGLRGLVAEAQVGPGGGSEQVGCTNAQILRAAGETVLGVGLLGGTYALYGLVSSNPVGAVLTVAGGLAAGTLGLAGIAATLQGALTIGQCIQQGPQGGAG